MKKLLFILLTTYALMADGLPQRIETTIQSIDANGKIELATAVPQGMSGIVLHNYGNNLSAITQAVISLGETSATVLPYTALLHENIPTIKTPARAGDKVILGNFYNNALVIAPNENVYNQVTTSYQKTWIHPDAFALDFMKEDESKLTLDNIERFAKANQVGLVLLVAKDRIRVLDPVSKKFLGAIAFTNNANNTMSPFYARFGQMDTSVFGSSNKSYAEYYSAVTSLR